MIVDELIAVLGFDIQGQDNLGRFKKGLDDIATSAGNVATKVGMAASVLGTALAAGVGLLGKSALDTGAYFEGLQIRLNLLEGSAEKGKEALQWIRQFAIDTPLTLSQAAEGYAMLKNFGLDPMNGSLQAAVDNMLLAGKAGNELQGILLPLGQAWSMGKLQGQDMMQLVNQGIPAWDLLAKSMGKTVQEVRDLSSKGKIGRKEMEAFFAELGKRGEGASELFSKKFTGIIAKLGDAWETFQLKISEAGFFEEAKDRLSEFADLVNRWQKDGTMDKIAKQFSDFFIPVSRAMAAFIQQMANHIAFLNKNWERLSVYIKGAGVAIGLLITRAWPLTTAFMAIGLAIEDLMVYFEGGDSLIGRFINKLSDLTGISSGASASIAGLAAAIGTALIIKLPSVAITIGTTLIALLLKFLTGPAGWILAFATIANAVIEALTGINLFDEGVKLISSLISGIRSMFPDLSSITNKIKSVFGFGPAEAANISANIGKLGPGDATNLTRSALERYNTNNMNTTVNVGGVTVNNANQAGPATAAAIGSAVGNSAASAAPARIQGGNSF